MFNLGQVKVVSAGTGKGKFDKSKGQAWTRVELPNGEIAELKIGTSGRRFYNPLTGRDILANDADIVESMAEAQSVLLQENAEVEIKGDIWAEGKQKAGDLKDLPDHANLNVRLENIARQAMLDFLAEKLETVKEHKPEKIDKIEELQSKLKVVNNPEKVKDDDGFEISIA